MKEPVNEKRIQLFVTLAGVAVALLNIWIITKLAPLAQDLAVLATRVDAIENSQIDKHDDINIRLDRIEIKLDDLIVRCVNK